MKKETNAKTERNGQAKPIEASAVMQKINEALKAVEQYKAENPGVDVDAILSAQNYLYPILRRLSNREVDKFVAHAKEQGTRMPFDSMGYFSSNIERMNYGVFSACGIYVGSGVIEAVCKVIVGNRMKNAGMHWAKDNAEKMISLRCAIRNGIFLDSYLHDNTISGKSAA